MKLFSKIENSSKLAVVFDLGSSCVTGALFLIKRNLPPEILYCIEEQIDFENNLDFNEFFKNTLKSLDSVIEKICISGIGAPKKIYCTLSSPWYSSQVRVISLKKDIPFLFNSKLADNLIKAENIKLEKEYIQNSYNESKIRPIELKNMRTLLNGYVTDNPIGKKAEELEMNVFFSMGSEIILSKIENLIDKHFHRKEVIFLSFAFASFAVARSIFVHQEDFSLVDIGGEITEICLIKEGTLKSSISFPLGYNYFIRGLSLKMGCSIDEAESFISLYFSNHMSVSLEKKIKPIIEKLKIDWLLKFQESLQDLAESISVSSTIFLTTKENFSSFFIDTIKNEEFNQYSFTFEKFKVIHLGSKLLHGIVEYNKGVKVNSFITIESIYINRFLN